MNSVESRLFCPWIPPPLKYVSGRKDYKHRRDTIGGSGCLKSTEHMWEPLRIQVDLPARADTPLKAKELVHWLCSATVGLQAPPAEALLDSQHLTKC